MEKVKVNRLALLETVKRNREKHVTDYEESLAGWKVEQEKALANALKTFRKTHEPLYVPGERSVLLRQPKSHEDDYDRAIRMLELCVEEDLELPMNDFDQWVMDNWQWQNDFSNIKALYASGSVGSARS